MDAAAGKQKLGEAAEPRNLDAAAVKLSLEDAAEPRKYQSVDMAF